MLYPPLVLVDPETLYALPNNLVLAASAGTGKTHALVGVVVNLLIRDRPPRPPVARRSLDPCHRRLRREITLLHDELKVKLVEDQRPLR